MARRRRWTEMGLVVGVLLAGTAAAHADDVEHRVVGVVPFPDHERSGAAVDAADVDALRFPQPGWVQRQFWDELVFDATEESDYDDRRTFGLTDSELANLDIYIKTTPPDDGVAPISEQMLTWWRPAIQEAVRELTGRPWRGRITTGVDSRALTDGRVNVGIGDEEDFADRENACAIARTAYYTYPDGGYAEWAYGEILFRPDDDDGCNFRDDARGTTMAHELGHVLGLFHVSDPTALMYKRAGRDRGYTRQLVDHAQLLYELGPGLAYPGFDSPLTGTTPEEWMGSVDEVTFNATRRVLTGRAWHNGGGQGLESERLRVIAVFLDAERDPVDEARTELRERSAADTPWTFELPTPEVWDFVLLVTVGQLGAMGPFGMDCTDADNRGQSGTAVDEYNRRIRACLYEYNDIEAVEEGWNPGTATQDLADRALEDLRSQDGAEAEAEDRAAAELSIATAGTELDDPDAEPVPALPLGGLGVLAGWLLLMGCRRRMQASTYRGRPAAG